MMSSLYSNHTALYPRLARAAYPGLPTLAAMRNLRQFGSPSNEPLAPVAPLYDPATPFFKLNPVLAKAWTKPARYRCFYGGRASSKSHEIAGFAVFLAATAKVRFLCVRQFQNKIAESSYALLAAKIDQSPWKDDFELTKNSIINKKTGSEFLFYGIARNLEEIKSTEGVDIVWFEESGALTEDQFNVIEPTIRKNGSEIWIAFNPDSPDAFSYQHFVVNPPEDCISILVNWDANQFLSETMRKVIRDVYAKDPKQAEWLYGGQPRDGSDESVINRKYVMAAVDAHLKLGWKRAGSKRIGFDVADDGGDKNAIVGRHGNVVMHCEEWEGQEDELLKSATRAWKAAHAWGASVTYDSIGVGASVGNKFKDLNEEYETTIDFDAFNAGGGVSDPDGVYLELPHTNILNKDHFSNDKAKQWSNVSERFRKTYEAVVLGVDHPHDELISLNSKTLGEKVITQLAAELSAPKKDTDLSGRFRVEQKIAMRKRGVKSPNKADAFVMAFVKPKRRSKGFFDDL